jgi:phosphate uptake regulator
MKRKIVRHGESTMTISLPAKWLKKLNIHKGDEVDIREKENHLIIAVDEEKAKTEITLNIASLEESSIRTIIANAYRLGYDKINVKFNNSDTIKLITEIVEKSLLGFEVIKKDKNECIIESVTEPSKEQYENIFSKVFLNIEELFNVLQLRLNGERQEFQEIDKKIQQYDNFCRRIIAKRGVYENNFLQWQFHSEIIHGARELYHLLNYLSKNKIKITKYDLEMLKNCREIFEMLKKAYINKDLSLADRIREFEKEITYKKGYLSLNSSANPIIVFHLIVIVKHFYLANSPLTGIIINN